METKLATLTDGGEPAPLWERVIRSQWTACALFMIHLALIVGVLCLAALKFFMLPLVFFVSFSMAGFRPFFVLGGYPCLALGALLLVNYLNLSSSPKKRLLSIVLTGLWGAIFGYFFDAIWREGS